MSAPNVVILVTPPGAAAIAVVRLSGDRVPTFLAERFSRPTPDGRCVHGNLSDEAGNVIDDAVVVRSRDRVVADVNLHGGPWVVQAALNLAERAGFSIRLAGDVPNVAYDAADALEREVQQSLPLARTELALRTLLAQPNAWSSAMSGFTRDDLERLLADPSLERLLDPPCVVIVGAPNVGKSTLANQLFAQARSITADLPGTTRDWVGEIANVDGLAVMLVDTPGVRETADAIEHEAIARSAVEVARADLVLLVLDASRPLDPEQSPLIHRYLAEPNTLVVVNKSDLAPPLPARSDVPRIDVMLTALTGAGVDRLRHAILTHFGCADLPADRPRVWTERQREIVRRAITDAAALEQIR